METIHMWIQDLKLAIDEWEVGRTKSHKGAMSLLQTGWEYVCTTPDDIMLFRKHKI